MVKSLGIAVMGLLMLVGGMIASWWNSYLIMGVINATSFMWGLWWFSVIFSILGSVISKMNED
jgi:hypothetical protein